MPQRFSLVVLGIVLVLWTMPVHAQSEAAVPFLLIPPSIEANGMGGISTSVSSDDAIAPLQNAGQLGLFSLRGFLNAGFYAPATEVLPQFNVSGMEYSA
jgi:hypothetical protein